MIQLAITVTDEAWPVVIGALAAAAGPIPAGMNPQKWAEQVVAAWFQAEIAGLLEPEPSPAVKPARRIRPSRIRS
jgi:hypothetical protein